MRLLAGTSPQVQHPGRPTGGIRILLATALDLIRVRLRAVLEREDDMIVVGQSTSGEHLLALALDARPDVLVIDSQLPGLGPLPATRALLADPELSQLSIVIFHADDRAEDLVHALRSGVNGFAFLGAEPAECVRAVRAVAWGGTYLSRRATQRLLDDLAANAGGASS